MATPLARHLQCDRPYRKKVAEKAEVRKAKLEGFGSHQFLKSF
jgi:hypothetical protein